MFRHLILALSLIAFALPAAAIDPASVAENVISEWRGWMQKHGISEGALVVAHNGEVIAESGFDRTIDDPAPIASLSKAITAVCTLHAAKEAGKSPTTPLSEAIPAALAEHAPNNTAFAAITLADLITHTGGITSTYHRSELGKLRTFTKENKLWQFSKLVKDPLSAKEYVYSNANYLTLGLAIEEMSGAPYEDYCIREILAPAGVTTARLHENWRVLSSYGGWEISARDYLMFAEASFKSGNNPYRPAGIRLEPGAVNDRTSYGAGVLFRPTSLGNNMWHLGSWRGVRGRADDRFGAYFALYDNGFSVLTNYNHDAWEGPIRRELDSLLYNTTHP